ncbi:cysteine-rich receptor-like protein kinase 10 [Rosa chinensis]|uniref:cysteine-rich receptor-like protein kinase 10 n=1 Tax=Rosa chinensis TaxID=74649 RepID=UPI001AD92B08|nr:cysteine-rich receptor-like protein kinase 10 [Rosa chinensis]
MAPKSSPSATSKWIWIGAAVSATLLVIAFCILCHLRRRRRKPELSDRFNFMFLRFSVPALFLVGENEIDQNKLLVMGHDLSIFSYASIMAATCNFAEENKLGEGGFGPVYKGRLLTGKEIAVKRLSKCSGQGTLEFKNELILIYELQHTNLVQLFGFCIHREERMLIYEYMPNKSLDYFLFDATEGVLLDWHKRFSIIEGITQGLLYLHKYSRKKVVHRDLKASNVLLDKDMNPKISDFGMARIFTHTELQINTGRIVGTLGYMPPEYAMNGIFSIKSDVYSFGVLMLEILSGRKNNSFYNDDRVLNLAGYAWELWKDGAGLQLMDSNLGDSCNKDQFLRCVNVGLLCVGDNAANRPTMSEVISMLTNESLPLPEPTKPSFCTEEVIVATIVGGKPQILSMNGMTISDMCGR